MSELLIKNIISEILFENKICESLEDRWIVNYFYDNLLCEKLLYGQTLTVPELRSLLRQKIINFQFIKLDGEIRDAKGTLKMDYVPQSQHPKGIRPSSPKVATFYDLEKNDWRSVSQRSKEIVLQKSEETGKPVVMVKDKPEGGDVTVKDTGIEKIPDTTKVPEKPTEQPEQPVEQPELTVDEKPVDAETKEPRVEVKNVKPVKSTEQTTTFHFVNPKTGASEDIEMTPKDAVLALKKMGRDWQLRDENEFTENDEIIKAAAEKEPDVLQPGDIRNYLNREGKNAEIEIVAEDPDGGVYAKTAGGGTFKIPANKIQNIGQKIEAQTKTKPILKSIIDKGKNLDNLPADEI